MSVHIRRAEERDIPAIMELLKQVNRIHYEGRQDLFHLTTKYTEEDLRDLFDNDLTPVFVAEDEDKKVLGHGFCILQHPQNPRLQKDILTLYVDDICVDETSRGQNIGRTIYEHILCFARARGCYNVTLNVWSCNPGAMRFYETLGLEPYRIGLEKVL